MYSTPVIVMGSLLHCARAVQLRSSISDTKTRMGKSHCYMSFKKKKKKKGGGVWGQRVYGDSTFYSVLV